MSRSVLRILAVEDDADDVEIIREFLNTDPSQIMLDVVNDGESALTYLKNEPPFTNVLCPNLVLLDRNLPRKNGKEVLNAMRGDAALRHIPVIVLSTSDHDSEILEMYAHGANCYLVKPCGYKELECLFDAIKNFWGTMVHYPQARG